MRVSKEEFIEAIQQMQAQRKMKREKQISLYKKESTAKTHDRNRYKGRGPVYERQW